MAGAGRPIKEGFDYFPLDTDFFKDRHVRRLIKKYDGDGVLVLLYLWCECYGDKGYYLKLDDNLVEDIADDLMIDEKKVGEILDYLLKKTWFVKFTSADGDEVITSTGVQKRYQSIKAQIRRKYTDPDPNIWLLDGKDKPISSEEKPITSEEKGISSGFLRISSDEQKGTEQNRIEVNRREQKGTEQKDAEPAPSDGFNKPFSEYLIFKLQTSGVDVKKNTMEKIREWESLYDPRAIEEAVDTAISKGVRSVIGYADKMLQGWAQGSGNPKWIEREEMALAEKKKEHMRPGALTRELMTTRKLE